MWNSNPLKGASSAFLSEGDGGFGGRRHGDSEADHPLDTVVGYGPRSAYRPLDTSVGYGQCENLHDGSSQNGHSSTSVTIRL